ncbi:MAG: Hsp20/alpha crystallin family protein [Myxococcota bacterium]
MLTRWNDFARLPRFSRDYRETPSDAFDFLRREMNRLFYDFENGLPEADYDRGANWPRVSLEDTGATLQLRADVPGLAEKDLELTLDNSTLTIKGQRRDETPEGYSTHRKERTAYRFSRSFQLPTKVDGEKTEAVLKNGVLNVTLHKAQEAQPRQINVRAS